MLRDAERVTDRRLRRRGGVLPCRIDDHRRRNAADTLRVLRRIQLEVIPKRLEPLRPVLDVLPVLQTLFHDHMAHRVDEGDVSPDLGLDMPRRPLSQLDLARVDDHQLRPVAHRLLHAERDHRVCLGGVGADDQQEFAARKLLDRVAHRTLAYHDRQTGDRWGMSGT